MTKDELIEALRQQCDTCFWALDELVRLAGDLPIRSDDMAHFLKLRKTPDLIRETVEALIDSAEDDSDDEEENETRIDTVDVLDDAYWGLHDAVAKLRTVAYEMGRGDGTDAAAARHFCGMLDDAKRCFENISENLPVVIGHARAAAE